MRRQLLPALTMLLVFTVITGIVYPLAVTGVGQLFFGDQANGALLERDGQVIGSAHIGQQFTAAKYFHPRPRRQATVTTLRRARAPTWDRRTRSCWRPSLNGSPPTARKTICRPIRWFRSTRLPARVQAGPGHIGGQCQAAGTAGGAGAQYLDKAGRASDRGPHRRAWSRLPGRARGERAQAEPRIGSPLTLRR